MIRAGSAGTKISEFLKGYVGIGFHEDIGDLTNYPSREDLLKKYAEINPNKPWQKYINAVTALYKFYKDLIVGDTVITYDNEKREYLIGSIKGEYEYLKSDTFRHLRKVEWTERASRDDLSISARNTLGASLTLFKVSEEIVDEMNRIVRKDKNKLVDDKEHKIEIDESIEQSKNDIINQAHELIKDKILLLDDVELEELVAAVLRAMGFKTKVSERGPDRGIDIIASHDGLGFIEPRIKVEVKHRSKVQIGAPLVRSFIANLRQGDKGLYVSTGGFTKEAKYEAERSPHTVTLVNLDELSELIVSHYESFDNEGKILINLVKVYWPAE